MGDNLQSFCKHFFQSHLVDYNNNKKVYILINNIIFPTNNYNMIHVLYSDNVF